MTFTQATREITLDTPLGEDTLLVRSLEGQEALSRLFHFELSLVSENPTIAYDAIVGKNVTVQVALADGSRRAWNGWVSRFAQAQRDQLAAAYRATVVPWLWFLGQTTDCRIFQAKTVPQILKQIFGEYGYQDYAFRLYGGEPAPRDYCVQYRETDLAFVSRLLEEEGIFYFFEHQKGKHTLVLANDPAAIKPCPAQPQARYEATRGASESEDVVLAWSDEQELRPGVYSLADYNFETPSTSLLSSSRGNGSWEMYDYPGEYAKRADGDKLARIRLEEQQMAHSVARGRSNCRAFTTGCKFGLREHFRDSLNADYVLTSIEHSVRYQLGYADGPAGSEEPIYENSFTCVPATVPVRPLRLTPVPVVRGCHTAVVVGPAGEEIFTDSYGRVKVQFHWDREGKRNENSSCWVRVSYPTAGKGWGGIHIPRIGQEVIVDFLEGDPDRPIITGRTYNAAQMPPWDLPAKGMVSGYKSNSTKGGGGYNEFSFDDTKGTELICVHGQFDMDTKIEHDERRHVINNRTKAVDANESSTIGLNRTEKVGVNEQVTIGANHTHSVGANELRSVKLTRTRTVGVNEMVNIGAAQEITILGLQALSVGLARAKTVGLAELVNIGLSQTVNIGAAHTLTIKGLQAVSVGATQLVSVTGSQATKIGAGQTIGITSDLAETIGGGHTESVTGDRSAKIGGNETVNSGATLVLEAKDKIVLKAGKASLVLNSDGSISLEGKDLAVSGSGKIGIAAKGELTTSGSKIGCN